MSRRQFASLILIILSIGLSAQEASKGALVKEDSMRASTRMTMVHGAGLTLGTRLTDDETVLFVDSTAIILGLVGRPNTLFATYKFDLFELPPNLQLDFTSLRVVILGDFEGSKLELREFHKIPDWLKLLHQLDSLIVYNAKLDQMPFSTSLSIKYLELCEDHLSDKGAILQGIGDLRDLKYLVHDHLFSQSDCLFIQTKLPQAIVISKSDYDRMNGRFR